MARAAASLTRTIIVVACSAVASSPTHDAPHAGASFAGAALRPVDIPPMEPFADFSSNTTWGEQKLPVAEGEEAGAHFAVIDKLVTAKEVAAILALVNGSRTPTFDADPDTVDGMPTHEVRTSACNPFFPAHPSAGLRPVAAVLFALRPLSLPAFGVPPLHELNPLRVWRLNNRADFCVFP